MTSFQFKFSHLYFHVLNRNWFCCVDAIKNLCVRCVLCVRSVLFTICDHNTPLKHNFDKQFLYNSNIPIFLEFYAIESSLWNVYGMFETFPNKFCSPTHQNLTDWIKSFINEKSSTPSIVKPFTYIRFMWSTIKLAALQIIIIVISTGSHQQAHFPINAFPPLG